MAGGLVGLLDDVAALAKLAAASVDDVGAAAARASMKAAPRSPERTRPSLSILATGSLFDMNSASLVTSRSVPSE